MTRYFNEDYIHEIIDSPSLDKEIQRIREEMGFSRTIRCTQCGHRRSIEIGLPSPSPALSILKYTGHDTDSRDLYYQCPLCKMTLSVDSVNMIKTNTVDGIFHSRPVPAHTKETSRYRFGTVVSVGLLVGIIFVIVFHFFIRG